MCNRCRTRAFTLIELLVVITIIVVLLALLTPALDKAIYQAELAACAARHKLVVNAVTIYATSFKRSYPYRSGVQDPGMAWWTHFFTIPPQSGGGNAYDDRDTLRPFMSINALNDPFKTEVDYDSPDVNQGSQLYNTLWAGFKYNGGGGMIRLGDRLRFPATETNGIPFVSTMLYSDSMSGTIFGPVMDSSHPDANGVAAEQIGSKGQGTGGGTSAGALAAGVIEGAVFSRWRANTWSNIGTFDMNYGRADGSVQRLMEVDWRAKKVDTRVERIGVAQSSSGNPPATNQSWVTLPPN